VVRRLVTLVVTLAVGAAVVAAPAGAATPELDARRLARAVRTTVTPQLPGLTVTRVTCPKHVKARPGNTAVCEVTASGLLLQMLVTTTDRRGSVTVASTQAVIPTAKAVAFVQNNATVPATVDCGPAEWIVRPPGQTFACTATFAEGRVQQVLVTVTDVAGNVAISSVT
jgi:hypothetical protein